jgi:predicted ester cyclase
MATEANKAVARRYFDEFLNQGKGAGGEDLFAPTYQSHFPGSPGPLDKQERDRLTMRLFSAFPDGRFIVEDTIAEGDQVVSRYTFRGTHQGRTHEGPFQGIAPTGKLLTFTGNEIHRIIDGSIVEQWSEFDSSSVARQLGSAERKPA